MVLRPGQDVRLRRARPDVDAFYGPAVDQKTSEAGTTPPSQAFLDDWLARTAELVDKYQPQLIWFDWWIAQPPSIAPAAICRVLLQPRRRVGQGRRDQLQEARRRVVPRYRRRARHRARPAGRDPPAVLADRHRGVQDVVGLRHEPRLQDRRLHRRRSRRHRQQERLPAAQHRAPARRHDPRSRAADAARDRSSGWGPTARRSTAPAPGRFSAKGRRRSSKGRLPTPSGKAFTAEDIRFTRKGPRSTPSRSRGPIQAF